MCFYNLNVSKKCVSDNMKELTEGLLFVCIAWNYNRSKFKRYLDCYYKTE